MECKAVGLEIFPWEMGHLLRVEQFIYMEDWMHCVSVDYLIVYNSEIMILVEKTEFLN